MSIIKKKMKPFEVFRIVANEDELHLSGKIIRGIASEGGCLRDKQEGFLIMADQEGCLEYREYNVEERARAYAYMMS